ncbi:AAA domain-containing protein [Mesobacillus maritimus]|uniref:AAA domain-containing protein n=1 Tax=Mesobacillus maritimus TaxID=1643336 RepID=UPI00203D94DC|nr:AAA domain-containing protein [Mesobacillus maritimus]MCM3671062.1 AAA domain-containing protein [Mesobacillus maritimus]
MSADSAKVARIFEYLLAVKNLNEKVTRHVNEYEKIWWEKDFPTIEGFYIGGKGTNEEAWYEVHKQEIPPPPKPPTDLKRWIVKYDNPDQKPKIHTSLISGKDDEGKESTELFDEDSDRISVYERWLKEWNIWAKDASPKKRVQQIYMELFTLHQRFQREGEDLELACGHGLLQWEVEGFQISRHVLVSKLELLFDAKKGIFFLIPTSKGTLMETDMLLHIDLPNATRLMQMENQVADFEFSPLDQDQLKPFLQEVVHTISPDGLYKLDKHETVKELKAPITTYSPALFLRNVGGRLWQQELSKVIEKIKQGFPVPETIGLLTKTGTETDKAESFQGNWGSVGEQLLFPLPTNKEQQLIAQKLATNSGVVIQGPPGTGKSHTIANLISHLLAHGKRVLVTSEKERALQVLKDKIPEEIRALCVSVLGGDSKSVKDIEDSVRTIAENLDSKQPEVLQENIERLTEELKTTKRNIARYDTEISKAAEGEHETVNFGELELTPLEGTKWLNKNQSHSWIPDDIKPHVDFPLSYAQLSRFFELLGTLSKEDIKSLSLERPSSKTLPISITFSQKVDEINNIEEKVDQTKEAIHDWSPNDVSNVDFVHWVNKTQASIEKLRQLQDVPWLRTIIDDCIRDSDQRNYWCQVLEEVRGKINDIQLLEKELIEHSFVFPTTKSLPEVKEDLLVLKEKLSANPKIGWFYKNVSGRKIKYLFEELRVNELPIRNVDDVLLLLRQIELVTYKQKLSLKWNRILDDIDGPQVAEDQKRYVMYIKEHCSFIEDASNLAVLSKQEYKELLNKIGKPGNPQYNDTQWYVELQNGLQALQNKKVWEEANEFFDTIHSYLSNGKDHSQSHPIWNDLFKALKQRNKTLWKDCFAEIIRLEGLEEEYKQFITLKNMLYNVVPKWTMELMEDGGDGAPLFPPKDLEHAWLWNQVDYWVKEIQSRPKVEQLEEERKREQLKEQKIIKDLVAESTWKEQIIRTTGSQKRSLFAWLKAVQRIGKGTGKYANIYRKDASKEMMMAKGAIPVWIMPIQRVLENFELAEDLFDVIIVDESSQSNLFSLSTLLRAKKAIIVGDENQISPESVGTEISDVHELIERFLYDIPNKMQFDIRTSLYDTANRVFDSKIVLKEHYRCVPEIIQFSNDLMYGGMIDPLRLPLADDLFDPPVKAIRVEDGYRLEGTSKTINEPEAEAIVDHIAKCIKDPKYNDKTFGVISLQGHDQARVIENLLREQIGEEEMINRKLITGDAYAFQGDERDIIFLSMVIAPNVNFTSLGKRSDLQRYNVAASRARDQMILFHSVGLNQLKPNDVRYQLLQYCKHPARVQEELHNHEREFDSDFEREVYSLISSRGYRVIPQMKVGTLGKRIDLVVEGMRTRLAIECDGDRWHGLDKWEEDMERQRVLERVGWIFWRVRGSAFYANPRKAMESLWVKLEEMGIEPNLSTLDVFEESKTKKNDPNEVDKEKLTGHNEKVYSKETYSGSNKVNPYMRDTLSNILKSDSKLNSNQQLKDKLENVSPTVQTELFDETEFENEVASNRRKTTKSFSLVHYFEKEGYKVIDQREKGGAIWVIGDESLKPLMDNLERMNIPFSYSPKGSRSTKKAPAWYSNYNE